MAAATVELGTTYLVGLVGLTQIVDALSAGPGLTKEAAPRRRRAHRRATVVDVMTLGCIWPRTA